MIRWLLDQHTFAGLGMLYLSTGLCSWTVGLFVVSGYGRSAAHRAFCLITLTGGAWLVFFGLALLANHELLAMRWLSLDYLAVPFISPSVYAFTRAWGRRERPWRIASVGPAVLLSIVAVAATGRIFSFSDHLLPFGRYDDVRRTPFAQAYMAALLLHFLIWASLAFAELIRAERTAGPLEKTQYRIFLIAAVIGYTGASDFLITLGIYFRPFGFLSFGLFVLTMAYAVVRHRFLGINLVLKRLTLIAAIYALLLGLSLPVAVPILRNAAGADGSLRQIVALALALGIFLSLGPFVYAMLIRRSYWLRSHLSQGLAHELKSPLSAIRGAADHLADRLASHPELAPSRAYIDMLLKNAARLDASIEELLTVARREDEPTTLERTPFDFAAVASDVVDRLRDVAGHRSVALRTSGIPTTIIGDRDKIGQTLSNIIGNAIKFSNGGRIDLAFHRQNGHLECRVRDEGRGLKSGEADRIFRRFYKADPFSKGTGLGLTIAKAWVEAHGGRIWAESDGEGKGTTVIFTLPACG